METEAKVFFVEKVALFFVAFEHGALILGELGVEDVEVGFVVEEEGAVVEIGGADGGEVVVHDEELAVHHGGGVLPDNGAGTVEFEEGGALGEAADCEVGVFAADDDLDAHPTAKGAQEGVEEIAVRNEVGVFEEDGLLGGVDGEQKAGSEGVSAVFGGAEAEVGVHAADGFEGREVGGTSVAFSGDLPPVFHEAGLELSHHGTANFVLGIAPIFLALGVSDPDVRVARAAGVGDLAIDHHDLAVGAVVVGERLERIEPAIEMELDPFALHGRDIVLIDPARSVGIEKDVHFDAPAGGLGEGDAEVASDATLFVDESFEGNRLPGLPDGFQHGRKVAVAILESGDLIAIDPRCAGGVGHEGGELRASNRWGRGGDVLEVSAARRKRDREGAQQRAEEKQARGHQCSVFSIRCSDYRPEIFVCPLDIEYWETSRASPELERTAGPFVGL